MMSAKQYDLIVLGTGGAGYLIAMRCKEAGWKVAVINDGLFGGTCSVRGCIPKKILAGTADILDVNRRLQGLGIIDELPHASWNELIKFKRTFTDPVPGRTEKALQDADIDVCAGKPRFVGNLQVEVNGQTLEGKKVAVAVGAGPAKLPIEGFEHLTTSDEFLELDNLPKRIVFVGGGYVSFEFAHIAARFGSEVTILEVGNKPLGMFDPDIVDVLLAASKDIGIDVVLNAGAQKIGKQDDSYLVTASDGKTYEGDLLVNGAGRPPAIGEMNLEATGVEYDKRRGILVDEYLCSTSNPNVYAAGDAAAAGPPLSPVAGVQGGIVADNLLGRPHKQPEYLSTSSVIFTSPAAAKVGYLEHEAKEKTIEFDAISTDLTTWFDSKRFDLKYAKSKVLVEKETNKIIGAHVIGSHAEDVINVFSLAINLGLTTDQLESPVFAFPTATDDMRYML